MKGAAYLNASFSGHENLLSQIVLLAIYISMDVPQLPAEMKSACGILAGDYLTITPGKSFKFGMKSKPRRAGWR